MTKPGHDSDCVCLSCNPWEPGMKPNPQELRIPMRSETLHHFADDLAEHGIVTMWNQDRTVTFVEPPKLVEFYLYRNHEGKWWDADGGFGDWTDDITKATIYPNQRAGVDGEWVKFVECPL